MMSSYEKILDQEDDLDLGKGLKIAQACMTTGENLKEISSKSQNSSSADTVNMIAQSSYEATPKCSTRLHVFVPGYSCAF